MSKLKVAVIGCGRIASRHIEAIDSLDNAEFVAVCDIKDEKMIPYAKKYGVKSYDNYRVLIKELKPDVVHICLPHYLHSEVSQFALKNGVNVLCEKPMSIDYESAVDTVKIANETKLKYGVISQCRYNTPSQLVKKRIVDGTLGAVKCGRCVLTWDRSDDYYYCSDWKGTWDKEGGGVIIDQAIHSIDLANWFIDSKPTEVQSTLHNRNHKLMNVEDSAEGLIKYENGAILSFYAMNSYFINEPIEIRLYCKNGTAKLSYETAEIHYNDGRVETVKNSSQKIVSYIGGKDYWGMQHAVQIDQFYKSVLGLEELEISGDEALKTHKIICDIYINDDNLLKNINNEMSESK